MPRRLGRRGNRDHVVEAHHDVGDRDNADGAPEIVGGRDLAVTVVLFGNHELDRDPEQQEATHQLQERIAHRLRNHEREQDAQQHRDAGAEDHAPEALFRRQHAAGERDHHRVVAGQDDIDADDLSRRDPEGRREQVPP